eukprot:8527944-Lingulodinium_polyedra.AAC.1
MGERVVASRVAHIVLRGKAGLRNSYWTKKAEPYPHRPCRMLATRWFATQQCRASWRIFLALPPALGQQLGLGSPEMCSVGAVLCHAVQCLAVPWQIAIA